MALTDFRWPLDPARAATRDETTLARALYSTPLRADVAGRVVPGLCSAWRVTRDFRVWRFRCRHARAIAIELRRVGHLDQSPARWAFEGAKIATPTPTRLTVRLGFGWRRFPYALTAVAAAPPNVPGPYRLVRGSPHRVVVERTGTTVVFRRMEPFTAVRAFRAGKLDEAPVPVGDVDALRSEYDVRVRKLLALDVVIFEPGLDPRLRVAYRDTADRGDYQTLLGTSMALGVVAADEKADPAAFRRALKAIPRLPRIAVRIARPPELDYGADILYGQWREAGLGPVLVRPRQAAGARFERLVALYPRAEALPASLVLANRLDGRATLLRALARPHQRNDLATLDKELRATAQIVPIAWVTDARLVSPRLIGWREDLLGTVDYSRVVIR